MTAPPPDEATREIAALLAHHPKGFDLSLDRIRRVLDRLGNPERHLPPVIHIAGTNGKGSASAFCRSLLEAGGHSVHVHTSPHLVAWHERYRIAQPGGGAGGLVDDATLAEAVRRAAAANADGTITVFELLTAVMFLLFSEHPADAAIVEVGLGGRFDATNVIERPAATLIMPISIDHQSYLGDRVELIAAEKAGIVKPGVPLIVGQQDEEAALDVIVSTAERKGSPFFVFGQDFFAHSEHGRLVYQDESGLADLPLPALAGRHQSANAAAAIRTVKAAGFTLDERALEAGLTSVEWAGRMQKLTEGRYVAEAGEGAELWVDGGHNPGAGKVVAETLADLDERAPRPVFLIAGMLSTKDPASYFETFAGMIRHVFTVPIKGSEAGIDPLVLADDAIDAGLSAQPVGAVSEALALIAGNRDPEEAPPRILIAGSLYLVGQVLDENGTPPR